MIHPHTYIHPNAKLATNVKVDPFTVIHQDVEIGDGTWIGSNVTIMEGARIGKNCRIFPGAVIAAIPQDLKFQGEYSNVFIGDNTTIREFVTVNRGTMVREKTVIGKNCTIMAYCHFAHDCIVGDNCIMSNNTQVAGHVMIGDWAIIGGMCAVHQFVNIGQHAFISGGSLVGKDVPPYIKAARNPLSYAGINSIGLKRRGFTLEKINHILDIFRVIYNKGLNVTQAIEYLEEEFDATDERDEIVQFIRSFLAKEGLSNAFQNTTAMKVLLTDAGKRFNRDWIFRHLTYTFEEGQSYAIIGPNGSGKSTLLQVISGGMIVNEGQCQWSLNRKWTEEPFKQVSICAPYLEVVEEMTLKEFFEFHQGFKPFLRELTIDKIISLLGLEKAVNKQIRYYSSGMKQRVRLAQAIFSDVPTILLDEPCTNLDAVGVNLYNQLINDFCKKRMVIVSSNDHHEYEFCQNWLNIMDWK